MSQAVPVLRLQVQKQNHQATTKTKALTLLSMVLKYRAIKYIPKTNIVESNINVSKSNTPLTSHGIGENNKNISLTGPKSLNPQDYPFLYWLVLNLHLYAVALPYISSPALQI